MHAAKWRHWKMHFIWQEYLYDLLDDPRERHHVFLRGNTWVIVPVGKMLRRWRESPQLFPPIPAGAAD